MYYTTGKSPYQRIAGIAVENISEATAQILIKKGYLVEKVETVESTVVEPEVEQVVETVEAPVEVKPQPKVVKKTKPKGRPKAVKK